MSLGKRLGFCLIGAALLAGLSGCATTPPVMHTQVTTFNQWTQVPADKSYVFGRTLEFQNSLELKWNEDIVRDELILKGFKEAANPAQAKLTVTLRPSISSRDVRVRDPWPADPFWSPYGWYGSRFGHRPFGWYDPYWSFPQYTDYSVTVYRHRLELDIDARGAEQKRLYEGRVESDGDTDSLLPVMPYLIRALFTDFPGNNGATRRVDVPIDAK